MKEILSQAAKAAKASQSQPKEAKASRRSKNKQSSQQELEFNILLMTMQCFCLNTSSAMYVPICLHRGSKPSFPNLVNTFRTTNPKKNPPKPFTTHTIPTHNPLLFHHPVRRRRPKKNSFRPPRPALRCQAEA